MCVYVYIYIYVYISKSKVKLATVVEGGTKGSLFNSYNTEV